MKKRKGLGRGLEALLTQDMSNPADDIAQTLAVDELVPGKYQPRQQMDTAALSALADSIRSQGVIQPILVRSVGVDRFEILAGERRWRAAKMAGLTAVPVVIRNLSDHQALMIGLIENIQREDLNAIEEAQGLNRLIHEFGMTHQSVAETVGRSRSTITNLLRLLNLPESVQALLAERRLEMGHARALLSLSPELQIPLAERIIEQGLSVRQTEQCVRKMLEPSKLSAPVRRTVSPDVVHLRDRLSDWLGAPVNIEAKKNGKGSIRIQFSDLDQLSALFSRFGFDIDSDDGA